MNFRSVNPRKTRRRKTKSLTKTNRIARRIKAARGTKVAKVRKSVKGERRSFVRSIAIPPDPKLPNKSNDKKGEKT